MRTIIIAIIITILTSCSNKRLIESFKTSSSDVLYVGLEQSILFETKFKNFHLETNIGTIEKIDDNHYSIYPDTLPGKLVLTVSKGMKKEQISFRVKPIPEMGLVVLADTSIYNSSRTTVENFQTFVGLQLYMQSFDVAFQSELSSYQITRISKGEIEESAIINTPTRYPNEANIIARKAQSGDIFLIENILVKIYTSRDDAKHYMRKLSDRMYYMR